MSVSISQGKRFRIESSTLVAPHDSSVYSNDAGRIRDELHIEKIQPQNVQHKGTIGSADPIINDDRADNHLLREFCVDMSNKVDLGNDALDTKWFQLPNAVVQQPQAGLGTASGNYTKTNTAGLNIELQLLQQNKTILELQRQMQCLLKIHLQQQQQILVNEEAVRQIQEEITHESAVKEVESMQTQPVVDEIGIVSMDSSTPLHASNEVNSLNGPESLPPPTLQRIPKRAEGSKVAINEKKQLSSNVRVQMCNDAHKHSIVNILKNSTLHPCNEHGKERDERQIEKMQRQNVQHKETIRSADPIINDDITDNHLLQTFCADMANQVDKGNDSLEPQWFQPPKAVVQQPQVDFGTASGNYTKTNTAGLNTELQFLQQNQMILELLKKMQGPLEIHLQQQQQTLLNEGNSPPLPAWNECLDGLESLPPPTLQRIPKRIEGSKVAINEEKQLSSNVRVQMGNDASKHSNVNIRKNSTLHTCKKCGKEFTRKSNLNRHLRTHTGEKPFECGECNEAFSDLSTLTDHQRTHTGEKPFRCQICNAAFAQRSTLSYHLLTHSNEKQFLCDICQRWFARKSTLSEHMKIHSGLKPWKCNVCQKSFSQKSNLTKHRKRHTKDKK